MARSLLNSRSLYHRAAFVALCLLASAGSPDAKATFATFDTYRVFGINATGAVTGWYRGGNSFVRTPDGTLTLFAVPEGTGTEAMSINDDGVIAGYYNDNVGTAHGFVRGADGTISTFDVRGAHQTYVSGINNKGEIVGSYADSADHPHGFLRTTSGKIRTFDPSGAANGTFGSGINDKGVIVGEYSDAGGVGHGFVRAANGSITTIDGPQAEVTSATAINIKGVITGYYDDSDGIQHGFIRTPDGTMTSFEDLSCNIVPWSINRKGIVTGTCENRENPSHFVGFLRQTNGNVNEFHVPDGGSTEARGINDSGEIAGSYRGGGFLRFP